MGEIGLDAMRFHGLDAILDWLAQMASISCDIFSRPPGTGIYKEGRAIHDVFLFTEVEIFLSRLITRDLDL